jgi:DNA-binding transcriptional LysR family regulator
MDLNRLNSSLFQTFLAVAEAGQISKAARRLHLSQPAVTGQIRRLEADLDATLFIRSAHGVDLTPRGVRLRKRLQGVFTELEQIVRELDQTREETGIVNLAASTTIARHFVPQIFVRFRRYHPSAGLRPVVGNTEEVLEHVREHRVGLGLVEGHERGAGVRLEQFMADEIVPVCAAQISDLKFRRAVERVRSVQDLETLPLIWREPGAGTRAVVESVLKDCGLSVTKLDRLVEVGSTEAIKMLVSAGLGVGFLSSWDIQHELSIGRMQQIEIPGLRFDRVFSWAIASGELGGLSAEFYRFANSIRSELSAIGLQKLKIAA